MGDFYQDMAKMARDLLAPTSAGGLGQGKIELVRVTPGEADPEEPWLPVTPSEQAEELRGVARGISQGLYGVELGGTVLQPSDLLVTTEFPAMGYKTTDKLKIDGKEALILSVENIPAAGITAAVKFTVRI